MKRANKRRETLPTVAIVGAGRLGTAIAQRLRDAGYEMTEIVARNEQPSLAKARRLAHEVKARAVITVRAELNADVVWFCVPDSQIASAAADLAEHDWKGKFAFHSSGVLSSDVLAVLREQGASVASLHPLMTFVKKSKATFNSVPFAVEGDAAAIRAGNQIIRDLRGKAFRIRKQSKIAYHAFATMICPLLVSLLTASERVAELAGMQPRVSRRRVMPIVHQTLANYAKLGPAAAFSGPIVRGDSETIAQHLKALAKKPEAKRVYASLAASALTFLPSRNRREIIALLNRSQTTRRNE